MDKNNFAVKPRHCSARWIDFGMGKDEFGLTLGAIVCDVAQNVKQITGLTGQETKWSVSTKVSDELLSDKDALNALCSQQKIHYMKELKNRYGIKIEFDK